MTITWNDEANMKLLYAILTTSETKVNYGAVAQIMGNDCTPVAIQRRLQKIVAQGKGSKADAEKDASPKDPKPVQKGAKTAKGRPKKRKGSSESDAPEDAGEEEEVIPKKRTRRAPVKAGD